MPLKSGAIPPQFAHYERAEGDGSTTEIIGTRQKCDCQPATAAAMLGAAVTGRGAIVKRSKTQMCGVSSEHILVTGLADPANHTRNIDQYFLRKGATFYSLSGYFDADAPPAGLDNALSRLCP